MYDSINPFSLQLEVVEVPPATQKSLRKQDWSDLSPARILAHVHCWFLLGDSGCIPRRDPLYAATMEEAVRRLDDDCLDAVQVLECTVSNVYHRPPTELLTALTRQMRRRVDALGKVVKWQEDRPHPYGKLIELLGMHRAFQFAFAREGSLADEVEDMAQKILARKLPGFEDLRSIILFGRGDPAKKAFRQAMKLCSSAQMQGLYVESIEHPSWVIDGAFFSQEELHEAFPTVFDPPELF